MQFFFTFTMREFCCFWDPKTWKEQLFFYSYTPIPIHPHLFSSWTPNSKAFLYPSLQFLEPSRQVHHPLKKQGLGFLHKQEMLRLKNKLIYLFEFWKRANLFLGPKWCPMRNAFSSPCSWRRRWRRRVRIHVLLWALTQLLMIFLHPCCCWSFSSSISISFLIPCLQCKVCIPIPLYSHKLYQPKRENKNIRKLLN